MGNNPVGGFVNAVIDGIIQIILEFAVAA